MTIVLIGIKNRLFHAHTTRQGPGKKDSGLILGIRTNPEQRLVGVTGKKIGRLLRQVDTGFPLMQPKLCGSIDIISGLIDQFTAAQHQKKFNVQGIIVHDRHRLAIARTMAVNDRLPIIHHNAITLCVKGAAGKIEIALLIKLKGF